MMSGARWTVGQLAKESGLSRSTLLYYDRTGLLSPSARSDANYRLYSDADRMRLAQILRYRDVGMPLAEIRSLLDEEDCAPVKILERRLDALGQEMSKLLEQQRVLVGIIQSLSGRASSRVLDKARWVALLEASGLDEEGQWRWHAEFERMAPQAHEDFLVALGIEAKEIEAIRAFSRER